MKPCPAIPELVFEAAVKVGSEPKLALSFATPGEAESLTYPELMRSVEGCAVELKSLGLERGDRVALCSENRPLWAVAYLGILAAGCICVPLDPVMPEDDLKQVLSHSGAKALLHSAEAEQRCAAAVEELCEPVTLGRLERFCTASGARVEGWPPRLDPDSEAVIIYTSGTTGRPKGVLLTHRNIVSNVLSVKKAIRLRPDDVFLSVLPLNHTFECTAGLLTPLSAGASVAYARSLRPRELRDALRTVRPTVILGVPLLYEKLVAGIEREIARARWPARAAAVAMLRVGAGARRALGTRAARAVTARIRHQAGLGRIRYLISGAAALSSAVYNKYTGLGIPILQGYGLTEASPVVTVNPPGGPKASAVGPAVPGVEIAIDSPGEDGVGEVLVRGENVMAGYFRNPEETGRALRGGWLRTGDLGWIDGDGYLHITGRSKNVIVSSAGKNVYPEEIEERLVGSPLIQEVVVVGKVPAEGRGEQPHAIVVPDREAAAERLGCSLGELRSEQVVELLKGEIKRLCAGLPDYKKVRGFTMREEALPKTTTAKVKRYLFESKETPL